MSAVEALVSLEQRVPSSLDVVHCGRAHSTRCPALAAAAVKRKRTGQTPCEEAADRRAQPSRIAADVAKPAPQRGWSGAGARPPRADDQPAVNCWRGNFRQAAAAALVPSFEFLRRAPCAEGGHGEASMLSQIRSPSSISIVSAGPSHFEFHRVAPPRTARRAFMSVQLLESSAMGVVKSAASSGAPSVFFCCSDGRSSRTV